MDRDLVFFIAPGRLKRVEVRSSGGPIQGNNPLLMLFQLVNKASSLMGWGIIFNHVGNWYTSTALKLTGK